MVEGQGEGEGEGQHGEESSEHEQDPAGIASGGAGHEGHV
jgi:hypothetical protein